MKTLDFIVRNVQVDLNESARYEQFLNWAYWGWREVFMDQGRSTKVIPLSINDALEAELPKDFIDWVSVYYEEYNRKITFVHDTNISKRMDTTPTPEKTNLVTVRDALPTLYSNYINRYGEHVGRAFGGGVPLNHTGYFNVDYYRGKITFDATQVQKEDILLEYLSSDIEDRGEILVHDYAVGMIREYIHWQRLRFSANVPQVAVREQERVYGAEMKKVASRFSPITAKAFIEAVTGTETLSPRNY